MTPEDFRRHGHQAIEWIAEFLENPGRYPVLSRAKPGELTDALPASGPETGEPMERILADFERLVVPAMTHWNHPGFMAYFANSATPEGILGEMFAATMNANGMLWKTSPAVTELEQVALRWMRQWSGLPEEWFGLIYDTASTSSMHAIAAAREAADPESRTRGTRPGLVVYTSEQAHSSVEKGAIAVGIGQDYVRKIAVDDEFRMRVDALQRAVEADVVAGLRPCCVTATVGTTSTTSVDPVPAIADICERYRMWLHVDAAYAGSAALLPEARWAFAGCDRADSFVTNPHKWLMTPMDCSVFYTRRPEVLRRAFSLIPEYLETAQDPRALNLMDYGVALGRRFRALKLWFVLRSFGREGLAAVIRRHIAIARDFASWVDADPCFERTAPAPFSVVNFRYRGTDDENRAILDRVNATGEAFLSGTVLRGRFTMRMAIGNRGTGPEHVARVWELVRREAGRCGEASHASP
jgi:aromatic-L-amino-acid/L-tryptophan decarboxylase